MSMQRLLVMTAVPFNSARLQSNISQNVKKSLLTLSSADNNESRSQQIRNLEGKLEIIPESSNIRFVKRKTRMLKNRVASQVSREKAKLKKELLEKQLLELQIEQMKIRLVNEALERKQVELEEENVLLRKSIENSKSLSSYEECVVGTFGQAEEMGTATSIHNSNVKSGRLGEQDTNTEFFKPLYLENSPYSKCNYNSSDTSTIAENAFFEDSLQSQNEYEITQDFDMIEKMIFGETLCDLEMTELDTAKERETFSIENESFYFFNKAKSDIKVKEIENSTELPLQWTFEDLYGDLDNFGLCQS